MSDEQKAAPLAPLDPEKGTLDPLALRVQTDNKDEKAIVVADTKEGALVLADKEKAAAKSLATKQPAPPRPKGPATKPKKKASRWIRTILWFNTYRCVLRLIFSSMG